ncbi:hypothetical protein ACTVZO_41375 [Streptomyces sp. IBSNAI002]|uniref:hypothetical protein n=1 Tax=Streptomyces sp. IBSNAI002 TaxID=3457500 RepID=UPI003FD48E89
MSTRHQAPIRADHSDGTECTHPRTDPECPGRARYTASCKKTGCRWSYSSEIRATTEERKGHHLAQYAKEAEPVTGRDLKPTGRRMTDSTLRLSCPRCGVLGTYVHRPKAVSAFAEHCDEQHPAPSPLLTVRTSMILTEDGESRWTWSAPEGRTWVVRQTGSGKGYVIDRIDGSVRSLDWARLHIAVAAKVIDRLGAEAARIELSREEAQGAAE